MICLNENKAKLTRFLTCVDLAADAMSKNIKKMIADDNGSHDVKTVGGHSAGKGKRR